MRRPQRSRGRSIKRCRATIMCAASWYSIWPHARYREQPCARLRLRPRPLEPLLARAGFRVRSVDTSAGMIVEALKLDHQGVDLAFEIISASQAVLQPGCCDAILCSSVIEYVLDPDELLRSFRRALRPSGVLIISYANRSSLWRAYMNSGGSEANPMYVPHHHTW